MPATDKHVIIRDLKKNIAKIQVIIDVSEENKNLAEARVYEAIAFLGRKGE